QGRAPALRSHRGSRRTARLASRLLEVCGAERLSPVAGLPDERYGESGVTIDVVCRGALRPLDRVCQSDLGAQQKQGVDMVGGDAGPQERATGHARLATKDGREFAVEPLRQSRPSPKRGPYDMNEHLGRGTSGHTTHRPRPGRVARIGSPPSWRTWIARFWASRTRVRGTVIQEEAPIEVRL